MLLARAIISRSVRDWRNHHFVRSLRERRGLRIVAVAAMALLFLLAVWGIAWERGGSESLEPTPTAATSPSSPAVVRVPEVIPLDSPPEASALEAAPAPRPEPKPRKGRAAVGKGAGKVKANAGENPVNRRAGGLRIDDF